ncbi:hypothetical protein Tco_1002569 [Tanacetum coccineum]|uniref:Uncharacterized protein n=1 Tax=Tanacetum coccineum TaxID=301880 RepID=A0ABQ5F6R2_9ASTR
MGCYSRVAGSDNNSQERHHVIDGINGIITFLEHWNKYTRFLLGKFKVLMIDELSIVETDKVIHTVETDMVKLVVEIKCFGMSFDEFDKETGSSDGLQPKQADLSCVHALNKPHFHEIHIVLSKHEAVNVSCVQIPNQFDICHKFAPLGRKSIQKLSVHLKLF